ncbi:ATP-binding protein [Ferruginibacter yonginensis]|uniref:histidine kinase n=1 Tax=Ferruginibacter yonginensis TaxID=1310416 RepID=A0ABV8QR84_9BACT
MKIKAKLILGIGSLFVMIVAMILLGTFFINKLANESKNILVANYNSIDYARKMLTAINNGLNDTAQLQLLNENVALQQNNISEVGEAALTQTLVQNVTLLKAHNNDTALHKKVQQSITDIMLLNMQAIKRKSAIAATTADAAKVWIGFVGAICFIIAFVLLFNLPGNIANPIKQLTASIQQIAAENYAQRLHFDKQNEFGDLATAFNVMAQKLADYKTSNLEKLLLEKKRFETLINNMHDPVIGLNATHQIIFINDSALQICGLKLADVLQQPIQQLAQRNDLLHTLMQAVFEQTNVKNQTLKIYANNKESYFEKDVIPIKITAVGEQDEKLMGNVILLSNITAFKELDFAKTNFIATVSHELKTPIAAIKMSLQLLANKAVGTLNTEQQKLTASIEDDANRLLKITGELLNMSQVESGVLQLSSKICNAQELVQYAIEANQAAIAQQQITIHLKVADHINVITDFDKTVWVLTNIISNAVRYSYENAAIKITVQQVAQIVQFVVQDEGQGIPHQYLHKIFDRYFRVPGSKKEGTGLGLSISKEFIEALGGNITVESDLGAGSSFTVSLPAA